MPRRVRHKWRPPLILVLGGSLVVVLTLPVIGLFVVDALTPLVGRLRAVFVVALLALAATLVLGWLLWRLILGPVRALAARAEAIRAGAAPEPMMRFGTPEIGDLSDAVLGMAEVLRARELAVRGYADHVTHELKTPLTAIRGAAELLASDPDMPRGLLPLVSTISEAETRAERLLTAARDIVAARTPDHHGRSCLEEIEIEVDGMDIKIIGGKLPIPLGPRGLGIVISHLASNARSAGATLLSLEASRSPEGSPRITIIDNGPGISPGNRTRIFDPFFTTRRDAGGTGMGLAIVRTLLLAHGADIALLPAAEGTAFRIDFASSP